jgi:crossover junction endodeoxyribonuclease RusA
MEFIVPGAPRSANANPRSRRRWRDRVSRAARDRLQKVGNPTAQDVSVLIIYFYWGDTALDVDNIAKALLDGLKGLLFLDDQQVSELLVRKTRLAAGLSLTGASPFLLDAFERMSQTNSDFVYVRTEAAPDHGKVP